METATLIDPFEGLGHSAMVVCDRCGVQAWAGAMHDDGVLMFCYRHFVTLGIGQALKNRPGWVIEDRTHILTDPPTYADAD